MGRSVRAGTNGPRHKAKSEVDELKRELAQERGALAATADVLKAISCSTVDVQTVLETLVATALRLCSAERGFVLRLDGQALHYAAGHNNSPENRDFVKSHPVPLVRTTISGRAALERRTVHVPDVRNYPDYSYGGIDVDPYRTVLAVPMCKAEQVVGVFVIYRHEVRPFTDSQIALMETFADQAVIAIENTRLLSEGGRLVYDLSSRGARVRGQRSSIAPKFRETGGDCHREYAPAGRIERAHR
jgi:two-component system, NtrC family, sensor kinase